LKFEGEPVTGLLLLNGASVTPTGASAPLRSADVAFLAVHTGGGDDSIDLEFVDPVYGFREDLRVLISGGDGADTVVGSTRADTILGGGGDDLLRGGGADDRIFGASGKDTISGDFGNDTVDGGFANDVVYGGGGDDLVLGGAGDDEVRGARYPEPFFQGGDIDEEGSDTLVGGAGGDRYVFAGSAQGQFVIHELASALRDRDSISFADYQHEMNLDLSSTAIQPFSTIGSIRLANRFGIEDVVGSNFADVITGDARANRIDGGPGDDTISGGGGSDTILGGDGNDDITGGGGRDSIDGGAGDDDVLDRRSGDVITNVP
jgi:Ca2+-binding RTX toxin-like protein